MKVYDLLNEVESMTEETIGGMEMVRATDLGLDSRAAPALYTDGEFIAVRTGYDRTLQYYGGFEYVDENCRFEMGGYVFYSAEDDRVREAIDAREMVDADAE